MLDVGRHPNIDLLAYSEVAAVSGKAGGFDVAIRRKARFVDEDKCTGCGACREKCPTTVSDAFNTDLARRKAIYCYFAQGIPATHTIDPAHCRQLNGKKCGICKKFCQAEAIDFDQKDRMVTLKVGAIIVATGYDVFDPGKIPEYRYGQLPNVVTAMAFERLLSASGPTGGHLNRPSDMAVQAEMKALEKTVEKSSRALEKYEKKFDETSAQSYGKRKSAPEEKKERTAWMKKHQAHLAASSRLEALQAQAKRFHAAKRLAFIQCVGSRDLRFYPFCSGYCCMHSIKEAVIAHEHEPETVSIIFGMDIRAVGKGFEEYKIRGENQSGIRYVRARVAEIIEGENHNPVVVYEDTRQQRVKESEFDMVILATACAPGEGNSRLATMLGIETDEFGFFKTGENQPMDTTRPGIFVCGCARGPMDIPESVAQASSAAARAVEVLAAINGPIIHHLRQAPIGDPNYGHTA